MDVNTVNRMYIASFVVGICKVHLWRVLFLLVSLCWKPYVSCKRNLNQFIITSYFIWDSEHIKSCTVILVCRRVSDLNGSVSSFPNLRNMTNMKYLWVDHGIYFLQMQYVIGWCFCRCNNLFSNLCHVGYWGIA